MIGICCIVLDDALNSKFGENPKQYSDSDVDNLRAMIYMMRCVFAHTPTSPVRAIKNKYKKVFRIDKLNMTMDFTELDGKKVIIADHNGVTGFCKLMDFCVKVVTAND